MHIVLFREEGTTSYPSLIPDPLGRMKCDDLGCWGEELRGLSDSLLQIPSFNENVGGSGTNEEQQERLNIQNSSLIWHSFSFLIQFF